MGAQSNSQLMLGVSIPINMCFEEWFDTKREIEDILESMGVQYCWHGDIYNSDVPDYIIIGEELVSVLYGDPWNTAEYSIEEHMKRIEEMRQDLDDKLQNKNQLITDINECLKKIRKHVEGDIQLIDDVSVINCTWITED